MAHLQISDLSRVSNLSELPMQEFRADVGEWQSQQEHLEVLRDKIPR
jgi:L-aspartate oxidase